MKSKLEEYIANKLTQIRKPLGNKDYNMDELIMNSICYDFDEVMMNDEDLKNNSQEFVQVRQLNFFLMSFISNQKLTLTEREVKLLTNSIKYIDQRAAIHPEYATYKMYQKAYRDCALEFLEKSAKFKLNEPINNNGR